MEETIWNIHLPTTPPTAAPIASGVSNLHIDQAFTASLCLINRIAAHGQYRTSRQKTDGRHIQDTNRIQRRFDDDTTTDSTDSPAMEAPKLTIRKIKYTIRFIIIYPTPSFSYCKNDLPVYYYTTIRKSPWSFKEKQWNFYSNVCVCVMHFRINVRYSIPGSPARSPLSCCTQIFPADS